MGRRHENAVFALLRIPVLRRMWAAITVSSLGDWLGLLANTALAQQLTADRSVAAQGLAISGVILTRLLPDVLLGPIAGALADKLDRRRTIIIGDILAGLLFLSIAIAYDLAWLYAAQFLIEAVGLFTMPAKQAIWVNIVPREKLVVANQMSLISVYGAVPVAAVIFALLSTLNRFFQDPLFTNARVPILIALVFNALTFFTAALTVYVVRRDIPVFLAGSGDTKNVFSSIREGISFIRGNPVLRGLYVGILGAFLAGGVVVGVAQLYVATLDAGNAGYSILFGTVFTGLALGMVVGPRILPGISRRRLFGLTIGLSGASVLTMSLMGDFVLVIVLALLVGVFGGIAWINGYTMIGYEVEDRLRGRVFAFIMSSVRVALLLSVAVGPLLAGWLGQRSLRLRDSELAFSGPSTVLLGAGVMATAVGLYAYHQVGGRGKRLVDVLWHTVSRPDLLGDEQVDTGLFIAFEGSRSDQITAQATLLAERLLRQGYPVISTREPGDTAAGRQIAAILTDRRATPLAPATECLLYLADRAEHVARVVRPALQQRQIVVCQRYVDSSVAYQGAGRGLDPSRIRRTSQWVTNSLAPDLTVVLDAAVGPDEDAAVRHMFLELAEADPDRYLVLPGDLHADAIATAVNDQVAAMLTTRSERVARHAAEPWTASAGHSGGAAGPRGTAGSATAAG